MADITYEWYIKQIKKYNNKSHWRVREFKKKVDEHIGGLRLTAIKMRGTVVSRFCNREANKLEKELLEAINNVRL